MALKTLQVKLEGKSQLHEPIIKLEGIIINIWSINGGLTWENKDIILNVTNKLEIFMSCKAISGTDWELTIKEKGSTNKCYEESGTTGETLESKNGQKIPNYSERITSVNC
ncbi:hypothetical protein [Flavobacterium sp.]|uniref:hypothetical protein n=1 Tax=Flavobacterium sp. TaxID=239 RepID=UPI0026268331|nr:hypothetical protein [Flavobacterium sp.]